jgi:hypothetical protein
MSESTYRDLIGKQEEKKNLQDLDTDRSQSNLSYRSRIWGKLAALSGSECWHLAESCKHETKPKVIPWLNS